MAEEIKTINLGGYATEDSGFFSDEEKENVSTEGEDIEEKNNEDDNESVASGGSRSSSIDTIKLLSNDPLFLVLSKTFANQKGENIVDILDRINTNLEKLLAKSEQSLKSQA